MEKIYLWIKSVWKGSWRHSFIFFVTFLVNFLAIKFNFLDLSNLDFNDTWPFIGEFTIKSSSFIRIFILSFISGCINYYIEWRQSTKGANKGKLGEKFWEKDWVRDTLVAVFFGFLGALISDIIF